MITFLKLLLKYGMKIDYLKKKQANIYSLNFHLTMTLIEHEVEQVY